MCSLHYNPNKTEVLKLPLNRVITLSEIFSPHELAGFFPSSSQSKVLHL